MTYTIIIQSIGLLAMALDIAASLCKNDKTLKITHACASAIFVIHYFLLGAIPGAVSEFFNSARTGLSAYIQSKLLGTLFLSLYILMLFIVPNTLTEALPFIASLSITIGLYFYTGATMRLCHLCGWIIWLIYSIQITSIGSIILFTILTITTTASIIKLHNN